MDQDTQTTMYYDDVMFSSFTDVIGRDENATTDPYRAYSFTSSLEHTLIVVLLAIIGLLGNALTIHIYRMKRAKVGTTYTLVLASVDIIALCTILPAYPFLKTMKRDYPLLLNIFVYLIATVSVAYLWILLAMTVERVVAVFRPFRLKQVRKPIERVLLGMCLSHLVLQVVRFFVRLNESHQEVDIGSIIHTINMVFIVITVVIIVIAYPANIHKLMQLGGVLLKYSDMDIDGDTSSPDCAPGQGKMTTIVHDTRNHQCATGERTTDINGHASPANGCARESTIHERTGNLHELDPTLIERTNIDVIPM